MVSGREFKHPRPGLNAEVILAHLSRWPRWTAGPIVAAIRLNLLDAKGRTGAFNDRNNVAASTAPNILIRCVMESLLRLVSDIFLGSPLARGRNAIRKRKYVAAHRLLNPLAQQGDGEAQVLVGDLHHSGRGVLKDYAAAEYWVRKSAEQGNFMGQVVLGMLYQYGHGVPQSDVQAYMWYNLAAAADPTSITRAHALRDELARHMTPGRIAEAQRHSREWTRKSSSEGSAVDGSESP
jgi:TPR repeat protein